MVSTAIHVWSKKINVQACTAKHGPYIENNSK